MVIVVRGFNSSTCEEWAKGPVKAHRRRPQLLIEANWPANPVLRLIKTRGAVVLSFVSPFNAWH